MRDVTVAIVGIALLLCGLGIYLEKENARVKQDFAVACEKAGGHPAWTGREWLCLPQKGR